MVKNVKSIFLLTGLLYHVIINKTSVRENLFDMRRFVRSCLWPAYSGISVIFGDAGRRGCDYTGKYYAAGEAGDFVCFC